MSGCGWLGSVPIVLSVVGAFSSGSARCEAGISTLRGIDRIKIVIEDPYLSAESKKDGITEDTRVANSS